MTERLRGLALRWGVVALIAQVWLAAQLAGDALDAMKGRLSALPRAQWLARLSQLRPAAFKSPWVAIYALAFALACAVVVLGMWTHAIRVALSDPPTEPRAQDP